MKNNTTLYHLLSVLFIAVLVTGCANKSSVPKTNEGRYKVTKDYGPDALVDVSHVQDAVPKIEPRSRGGNRSRYEVLGKQYSVMPSAAGYNATGGASWYGKKFHGHLTANGEKYDMYQMTAAHKSLPIPTYVRVTNLANNRQVIVRVNDRGPFHKGRIIDLSYAAASKLDMLKQGTSKVRVEAINPATWKADKVTTKGIKKTAVALNSDKTVNKEFNANSGFLSTSADKPVVIDNMKHPKVVKKAPAAVFKATSVATIKGPAVKSQPKVQPIKKAAIARSDLYRGIHYVQVGVYSTEEAAHAVTLKVNDYDLPVLISEIPKQPNNLYKVILGPVKSRIDTQKLTDELAQLGFPGAHLIDLPK